MRLRKPNSSIAPRRGFKVPLKDGPTETQLSRLLESRPSVVKVEFKISLEFLFFFSPPYTFGSLKKNASAIDERVYM